MLPLVSVIVPSYNHASFIQETLKSIIAQTYPNIELIVIDDGSKDETVEKIKELEESCRKRFVRFEFRSRENRGLCNTLNEGLSWIQGEYFSSLASDDAIFPDKIEHQVNILRAEKDYVGVFGGVELIDNFSNKIRDISKQSKVYYFEQIFLHKHTLPACTQLLRTRNVLEIGGYNNQLRIEDWYMWLMLTQNGGCLLYVKKIYAKYRLHESNYSGNTERMHLGRYEVVKLFASHPLFNKAKANSDLVSAIDSIRYSRKKSLSYFFSMLSKSPSSIFQAKFLRYAIKFFMP